MWEKTVNCCVLIYSEKCCSANQGLLNNPYLNMIKKCWSHETYDPLLIFMKLSVKMAVLIKWLITQKHFF